MNKNMGKVIALCGKIASGKTYYANQIKEAENAIVLSVDELTFYMFDNRKGENYIDLTQRAINYFQEKAIEIIRSGVNVILDIGLWTKKSRANLRNFFYTRGISFEIHYLEISNEDLEKNIKKRNLRIESGNKGFDFYVTETLKEKNLNNWEEPTDDEVDCRINYISKG